MQSHPTTLLLVARTRVADRQREVESVRLAEVATSRASATHGGLRRWLAHTLRATADRLQPSVADLPIYGYR